MVEQVEGRDTTPSIVEIHEKLINKEAKLLSMNATTLNTIPVAANVATSRPRQNNNYNQQYRFHNSNWNNNKPQQHYNNASRHDSRSLKGYQGKCQICSVFGHNARRCPQLAQSLNSGYNPSPFQP